MESCQRLTKSEGSKRFKGVRKLNDCQLLDSHNDWSLMTPPASTTALSVPKCRVQHYSALHWILCSTKKIPSRQSGSGLRKALTGISERPRKESTAGGIEGALSD